MNKNLIEILACPICKGKLTYDKSLSELVCKIDKLAFPVKEGIPVMLEKEARAMTPEESEKL